jgi:hypothetical protein
MKHSRYFLLKKRIIINYFISIFLFGSVVFFLACSDSLNTIEESIEPVEKNGDLEVVLIDRCTLNGSLTEAEIEGLMEMREEEKLAGNVYTTFFEMYNQIVFKNISKSEAAHTKAVLYLINGYGLDDPALEITGEFTNPLFNDLFKQLTEKGSASLVEALKVGAFIEEYDINDLNQLLEETENADVARVYGNLLKASKIHLRAFTNVLKRYGETYSPTIISESNYLI